MNYSNVYCDTEGQIRINDCNVSESEALENAYLILNAVEVSCLKSLMNPKKETRTLDNDQILKLILESKELMVKLMNEFKRG